MCVYSAYKDRSGCFSKGDDCEAGHTLGNLWFQDVYYGGSGSQGKGLCEFIWHLIGRVSPRRVSIGQREIQGEYCQFPCSDLLKSHCHNFSFCDSLLQNELIDLSV